MKKVIAFCACIFVAVSMFSLDMNLGARVNFNTNWGTSADGDVKKSIDFISSVMGNKSSNFRPGFGGGVYGNCCLYDTIVKVGLQPELIVNGNGGVGIKGNYSITTSRVSIVYDYDLTVNTVTIDLPVLITAGLPLGSFFELGIGFGPQVSIPVYTKYELVQKVNGNTRPSELEGATISAGPNVGFAFDLNTKFKFGEAKKIALLLDFRYNLDLTPTKITVRKNDVNIVDDEEAFVRRGLAIGAGCEFKF